MELRVQFGEGSYQVDLTIEEFEKRLSETKEEGFIELPCMFGGSPCFVVKTRPRQIQYYYIKE